MVAQSGRPVARRGRPCSNSNVTRRAFRAVLLAALAGCTGSVSHAADTQAALSSSTMPPPATCTAKAVDRKVRELFEAINTGDAVRADSLVSGAPRFMWFAIDPDRWGSSDPTNRDSLRDFFVASTGRGLTIQLVSLQFNGYRVADQTGNFGFSARWGDRQRPVRPSGGKGAIDCTNGTVMVFVLAART